MTVRITFKGRIDVSAGLNDIHHIRRIGDDTKAAARQSPNYIKKTKQKIKYDLKRYLCRKWFDFCRTQQCYTYSAI